MIGALRKLVPLKEGVLASADELLESAPLGPAGPVEAQISSISRSGDLVFVSGQVAMRSGELLASGLVGQKVGIPLAQECARQCARNLLEVLQLELGSLDRVEEVIRLAVYVASDDGFTDQHIVAHGASQMIVEVLGPRGQHVRTAIGVKALPLGSPVEVDAVVRAGAGNSAG